MPARGSRESVEDVHRRQASRMFDRLPASGRGMWRPTMGHPPWSDRRTQAGRARRYGGHARCRGLRDRDSLRAGSVHLAVLARGRSLAAIDNASAALDNAGMPIGIDWGGTQIKGAVVERERVLSRRSVETPIGETPAAALDAIAALVRRLASGPDPVGVAIPGEVRDHGRCWRLPNVPVSMESILPIPAVPTAPWIFPACCWKTSSA